MADSSDVEQALVNLVFNALYPNGASTGSTQSPISNCICDIRRGWPLPKVAEDAVTNDAALITVHLQAGVTRNTTRYETNWQYAAGYPLTPTLTVSQSGSTATFAGTGSAAQVAAIKWNNGSTGITAATYRLGGSDGPLQVAAALAAAIPGAAVSGSTVTVADMTAALTGVDQIMFNEVGRECQMFCISIWAPDEPTRSAIGSALTTAIMTPVFIPLPEGSFGRLILRRNTVQDNLTRALAWYRDLAVEVEYGITQTQVCNPALVIIENISSSSALIKQIIT